METISREAAKALGLTKYFTGKPCKHGHVDMRKVSNTGCCECARAAQSKWRRRNPEKEQKNLRKFREQNAEKLSKYRAEWRDANREKIKEWNAQRYQANKAERLTLNTKRKGHVKQATPEWVSHQAIQKIYEECQRLSKETGIPHHVDHMVPLRHERMSGLHVPWNLQIIPAQRNLQKSNSLEICAFLRAKP